MEMEEEQGAQEPVDLSQLNLETMPYSEGPTIADLEGDGYDGEPDSPPPYTVGNMHATASWYAHIHSQVSPEEPEGPIDYSDDDYF